MTPSYTPKQSKDFEVFYHLQLNRAIVCPNKCGTNFLYAAFWRHEFVKSGNYAFTPLNFGADLASAEKKFLIYRDPIERFVSWYKTFVIGRERNAPIYARDGSVYDEERKTTLNLCHDLYDRHLSLRDNLIKVLNHPAFAESYIEEKHINPIASFFLYEPLDQYEIIHSVSLVELVKQEFGVTEPQRPFMPRLSGLHEELKEFRRFWQEDYDMLLPRSKVL